jgi:hypothetical protein
MYAGIVAFEELMLAAEPDTLPDTLPERLAAIWFVEELYVRLESV